MLKILLIPRKQEISLAGGLLRKIAMKFFLKSNVDMNPSFSSFSLCPKALQIFEQIWKAMNEVKSARMIDLYLMRKQRNSIT